MREKVNKKCEVFHSHGKNIFIRTTCRTVHRASPRSGYGFESESVLENASAVEVVHEPESAGGGDGGIGLGNGVAFGVGYAFEVVNAFITIK